MWSNFCVQRKTFAPRGQPLDRTREHLCGSMCGVTRCFRIRGGLERDFFEDGICCEEVLLTQYCIILMRQSFRELAGVKDCIEEVTIDMIAINMYAMLR